MRLVPSIVLALTACGVDVRPQDDDRSDPGVDGGIGPDGGSSTTVADARVPPPDGIPDDLTPCEEAVYHAELTWIKEHVFSASCVNGCHHATNSYMSLTPDNAYRDLVDVASRHTAGWVRVAPGNPGASMLMVQIGGEPGPELEGLMPWGQPMLCVEKIDAIRRWIASGAPNN